MHRRIRPLWIAALLIALGGLALSTAVLLAGAGFDGAGLALLLTELVALALLFAWAVLRFRAARGATAIPLAIGAGFVVVAVFSWVILSFVWWFIAPNAAEVAVRPLARTILDEGGRLVCSGGDPGRGPDNIEPRYFAVYEVPASVTPGSVRRSAARLGIEGVGNPAGRAPARASVWTRKARAPAKVPMDRLRWSSR